jgi:hypothetical protein
MDSTNYSGNSSIFPKAIRLGIHGGNDHVPNLLCYLEVAVLSEVRMALISLP